MTKLLNIIQQIVVAANVTATSAIVSGMLLLTQTPQRVKLLRDDLSCLGNLIKEVLRLGALTLGMWRVVTQDTALEDVELEAGAFVMIRFDVANRDFAKFQADKRLNGCWYNASDPLSFGHGIHFCLSARLARKQMQIAYQRLLSRLEDIRLTQDYEYVPNVLMRRLKDSSLHLAGEIEAINSA